MEAKENKVDIESTYMEDTVITLPSVKDGVIGLGDLWNCHESKACAFNLFDKSFEKDDLIYNKIAKNEYSLIHVKNTDSLIKNLNLSGSVKLELLGGFIPLEASAGFERCSTKSSNEENIICKYYAETFSVELKLSRAKEYMDKCVKEQIFNRKIKATHAVTCVILGGEVIAHLSIKQRSNDSDVDLKGDITGHIKFGPIDIALKSKLKYVCDNENSNYEKHITISSKPTMGEQPTSIEEMFNVVESIDNKISNEQHYDMIGKKIYGVPIRYRLVPITHIVDVDVDRLYMRLADDFQEKLCSMLTLLHDYSMVGFVSNMVIEKPPRVRTILKDTESPITIDIKSYETDLIRNSEAFMKRAFDAIKKFKSKQSQVDELLNIVDDFTKTHFNQFNVEKKLKVL